MVPHPPLIVPQVGRGEERAVATTEAAYRRAAELLAQWRPETIVLASPHAVMYADYFHVSPGKGGGRRLPAVRHPGRFHGGVLRPGVRGRALRSGGRGGLSPGHSGGKGRRAGSRHLSAPLFYPAVPQRLQAGAHGPVRPPAGGPLPGRAADCPYGAAAGTAHRLCGQR